MENKTDRSNPPVLQAVSQMTGLHRAVGDGLPPPDVLREHQDLWGIVRAVSYLLLDHPETRVIRTADIMPYLKSSITGDKRSGKLVAAQAAQVERMKKVLDQAKREIIVGGDGTFTVRDTSH